jgi:hypothetical protein
MSSHTASYCMCGRVNRIASFGVSSQCSETEIYGELTKHTGGRYNVYGCFSGGITFCSRRRAPNILRFLVLFHGHSLISEAGVRRFRSIFISIHQPQFIHSSKGTRPQLYTWAVEYDVSAALMNYYILKCNDM